MVGSLNRQPARTRAATPAKKWVGGRQVMGRRYQRAELHHNKTGGEQRPAVGYVAEPHRPCPARCGTKRIKRRQVNVGRRAVTEPFNVLQNRRRHRCSRNNAYRLAAGVEKGNSRHPNAKKVTNPANVRSNCPSNIVQQQPFMSHQAASGMATRLNN